MDYFTVTNPYLSEVQAALELQVAGGAPPLSPSPSLPLLLDTLSSMFHAVRFRAYPFSEKVCGDSDSAGSDVGGDSCINGYCDGEGKSEGAGEAIEAQYTLAQSRREREQFLSLVTQLLLEEEEEEEGEGRQQAGEGRSAPTGTTGTGTDDDTDNEASNSAAACQFLALFDGISGSTSVSGEGGESEGGGHTHPAVRFLRMLPTVSREVKRVISDIGE